MVNLWLVGLLVLVVGAGLFVAHKVANSKAAKDSLEDDHEW